MLVEPFRGDLPNSPFGVAGSPRAQFQMSLDTMPGQTGRSPVGRTRAGADPGQTGSRHNEPGVRFAAVVGARPAPRRIRCPRRIKAGSNALQGASLDPPPSLAGRSARGVPLPAGLSDAKVSLVGLHRNIRVTRPATHLTRCQLTTTFGKRSLATVRRSRLRGGFSIIDEPRGHDVGPDGEWVERYKCRADAASS